ncbi:D-alanyl-D-alanine carboxypeptidase/D-alanyl-D-alanine endopeptidase [Shewanella dokdonensis]|uniref:D-alanyl-D-alanine carboxypeptidase/D-alanyl-D-alanine endopeptidase n=1 Tax=Shewanella dokdonensis TaxID=712036 RepID=UPI00200C2AAA|nr:D-alanyl-D-alanine carboxypeptidase/D-alanyl-D-alanine-endopeptidase [Shewanella dokdonensis]MCL1073112.1 D-alanyl-D-alanine carboxypeptidase/D-alanyl-D-alanine-endopeptidase [Shewanella dokdonensis]
MTIRSNGLRRWTQGLTGLGWLLLSCSPSAAILPNWLQPLLPTDSQTALWVQDTHSGEVLVSHNPDVLMLPASTQKLLTAVTAWQVLGEDFRFHTRLYTTGKTENGILNGDLYLQFDGDPRLTRAQLAQMAAKLADSGIQHITGKLVLVGSNDSQWQAPGWVWDDLGICYAAPVSSFVIDQNCVKALLLQRDQTTQVKPLLPAPISVRSNAYFDPQKQQAFCQLRLQLQPDNHYQLTGCYAGSAPLPLAIAVNDPSRYAADVVSAIYQQQFAFKGPVSIATDIPPAATLLFDNRSEPLSQLISEMLLDSDNLIADTLLKQAGQQRFGKHAGFAAGSRTVKETLEQFGISMSSSNIADGSGLSRYNLLSARQLAQLLQQIQRRPALQWLTEVLPKAGISGTLQYKRPFNRSPLRGAVVAKTGSMSGVQNLAGFLSGDATHDKNRYLFVVLENGLNPQAEKHKRSFMAAVMPALQQHLPVEPAAALSQQKGAR